MKAAIDLHIHTALSPCSDNEMTPNNIVNMAYLKGLDIIAITDHNTAGNFKPISLCAENIKIIAVPGMELETREEVHLVCLFPDIESVMKMQDIVFNALPKIENREDVFGQQLLMDEEDNIIGVERQLLITATDLGAEDVFMLVRSMGGVVIPAHVDRNSYSILSNLGMIPEKLEIKYLELSKDCDFDKIIREHPELNEYKFIKSSDAHSLGSMLEKECFIELDEISIRGLFKKLRE